MKLPIAVAVTAVLSSPAVTLRSPAAAELAPERPFGNRIVMSQTPEIGKEWHGGVRMKDLLHWDAYWNAGGLLTIDIAFAGVHNAKLTDSATGDRIDVTDNLMLISVKSRPLEWPLKNHPYKLSGGLCLYSTSFEFFNEKSGEGFPAATARQGALFVTQSWCIQNRHYVNLLTSVTSRKTSDKGRRVATLYAVPGYRGFFGSKRRWSFDIEYLYMNPVELPIKTLQILTDPDKIDFYNPDRRFVSFMFWGFSYSRSHVRIELHMGNHISFAGPKIPLLGIGWNF